MIVIRRGYPSDYNQFYEDKQVLGFIPSVNLDGKRRNSREIREIARNSFCDRELHLLKMNRQQAYIVFDVTSTPNV